MKDLLNFTQWAGTDEALQQYLIQAFGLMRNASAVEQAAARYNYGKDEKEEKMSRLLSVQGNVGVVAIHGSLNNSDCAFRNEMVGATGYPEIRDALIQAAVHPDISQVVLDINSAGGAVPGLNDIVELVRKVDTEFKPVLAFTDGGMLSAAYWIGSAARSVQSGKVAELGSIGIMTVHTEYTKLMQKEGITHTVLRAGEFKGLGHPMETLSAKAREQIQERLDQMYTMFIGHVAQRRGVSVDAANQTFGEGRVFLGERAVGIGLSDGLTNFDALIEKTQAQIDKQKDVTQSGSRFSIPGSKLKTALTKQNIAALEEGLAIGATDTQASTDDKAPVDATKAVEVDASADENAKSATDAKQPAALDNAGAKAEDSASTAVISFLKAQLADSQTAVLALSVQVSEMQKEALEAKANTASFRGIAQSSVERLRVALGQSATSAAALADDALLAEHTALRTQFESKFKAGGVAAVAPLTENAAKAKVEVDPVRKARIQSSRLTHKE